MSTFDDHSQARCAPPELGHGIVAELEEDALVELRPRDSVSDAA